MLKVRVNLFSCPLRENGEARRNIKTDKIKMFLCIFVSPPLFQAAAGEGHGTPASVLMVSAKGGCPLGLRWDAPFFPATCVFM